MQRAMSTVRPLLIVALVAVMAASALACPTCKDAIAENDIEQQALARGFYYSIIFMMSMPFLILGTFGSFAYLSIRRSRVQQGGELDTDPSCDVRSESETTKTL
jgi:cytochrome bd-type quinol oxidase subunit 2